MTRWIVSKADFHNGQRPTARFLGYVEAPHMPAALEAACKAWPDEIDENQTQRGFSVRLSTSPSDHSAEQRGGSER